MSGDEHLLPDGVRSSDDRIVVTAPTSTRVMYGAMGAAATLAGLFMLAAGPGVVGDQPLARFGIGGVLVIFGLTALASLAQRLEVDAQGVRRRSVVGTKEVNWTEVQAACIEQRHIRAPVAGTARRLGPFTVTSGLGGGRRGGVRRDQPVTELRFTTATDSLSIDLHAGQVDDGRAILEVAQDRGWLPSGVQIEVVAGER